MSRESGFVPIRFHIAGRVLLLLGAVGLTAAATGALTGWFSLPSVILYASLAAVPVGLYLVLVVPREPEDAA